MGRVNTKKGAEQSDPTRPGFTDPITVQFNPPFENKPKVIVAISAFNRERRPNSGIIRDTLDNTWGVNAYTRDAETTESQFVLRLQGIKTKVDNIDASWIACDL